MCTEQSCGGMHRETNTEFWKGTPFSSHPDTPSPRFSVVRMGKEVYKSEQRYLRFVSTEYLGLVSTEYFGLVSTDYLGLVSTEYLGLVSTEFLRFVSTEYL